mmetsp:Transcript_35911/g.54588  ORF Transcript_35911/g.54588 Transcript_35911/m.54588 type:complete len:659 (-) Transcript_35911:84-2060(-)
MTAANKNDPKTILVHSTTDADDESFSLAPPSYVELATLTIPPCVVNGKKEHHQGEVILNTSTETATALEIDAVEKGGIADENTACIQAVVDLTELSDLAFATENEFVVGLHREANHHTFNPDDSEGSENEEDDENFIPSGEETPLLRLPPPASSKERHGSITTDVHLDINSFTDAVKSTFHDPNEEHFSEVNIFDAENATATENNVQIGHDAFLIEMPQKQQGTEHHFVLALPEVHTPHTNEAEEEDHHFQMLEKALSIIPTRLPTDIKEVRIEATTIPVDKVTSEINLDMVIKRQVPLIGYVILFLGFFALSSVGAALELQGESVTPSMKTYWRLIATALAILPQTIQSLRRDGLPKLSWEQWILFPLAAMAYGYMTTAFVVALSMTSLANTVVLANLTSLVIIIAKGVMGLPVLFLEGSGALIGITGAVICSRDTTASTHASIDANDDSRALAGNIIALSASFAKAAYLTTAKSLRPRCDLFVFMFGIFFISSLFVLAFILITEEPVEFSRHPNYGLFGWTNTAFDRLPLELYIVYVCNFLGAMGYIAVLKYFDSIVIATIMLMEPVSAVFIGFWAGVSSLPGMQTWIGDAIVTMGSGMVIYSGSSKTESIDATKAVRPKHETIDIGSSSEWQEQGEDQTHAKMLHTPVMMKRPSP